MNFYKSLITCTLFIAFFSLFLLSCKDDDDDGVPIIPSNTTTELTSNLSNISNNFRPDSLGYSQSKHNKDGDDPCDFCEGESSCLYDCQPVLLRLYIQLARTFLDATIQIVGEMGYHLGMLSDGSSGTHTTPEDMTILYDKTSSTDFSLLIKYNDESVMYIDMNDDEYRVMADFTKMPETEDDGSGVIDIAVTYTNADTWTVETILTDVECEEDDPRAPERFRILMTKDSTLWKGKAILYSGRWAEDDTCSCSTVQSDEKSMCFYTDFVGDSIAAKANVYTMQRDKDDFDFDDFGLNNICVNYWDIAPIFSFTSDENDCNTYLNWSERYPNPFCNHLDTAIINAEWGCDCSDYSSTVANESWGSADDWVYTPYDFYHDLTINLPTNL
ncbi:MAG: hypothetical protein SVZ03_17385 [Spirochaetota bacterium]|nr:hypothetical protein [Spirochaetota bacterium]